MTCKHYKKPQTVSNGNHLGYCMIAKRRTDTAMCAFCRRPEKESLKREGENKNADRF